MAHYIILILSAFLAEPQANAQEKESKDFIRGDADMNGRVNIADAVVMIRGIFGKMPVICYDAVDFNDDGKADIRDPIHCLNYLFGGGFPPPSPFPDLGQDPTPDLLEC